MAAAAGGGRGASLGEGGGACGRCSIKRQMRLVLSRCAQERAVGTAASKCVLWCTRLQNPTHDPRIQAGRPLCKKFTASLWNQPYLRTAGKGCTTKRATDSLLSVLVLL